MANVIVSPRNDTDGDTWEREIRSAERAVLALLNAKRKTLREEPEREAELWNQYRYRLRDLKRNLDAAVL